MYQQTLNKIIAMVKISEAFDQTGYVDESINMMFNAFELAEQTTYQLAEKIENNMTKTASKNNSSDINRMDRFSGLAQDIAKLLGKGIGEAGEKWEQSLLGKPNLNLLERAKQGIGKGMQGLGGELEGSILRTGPMGAFRAEMPSRVKQMLGQFTKLKDPLVIEQELVNVGVKDPALAKQIAAQMAQTTNPQEVYNLLKKAGIDDAALGITKGGLTSGAKLGLGLGAAATGAGALSALNRKDRERPLMGAPGGGYSESPVELPAIGSGYGKKSLLGDAGVYEGPSTASRDAAGVQMASIEQRMSNLEQVVNAIRSKVGV